MSGGIKGMNEQSSNNSAQVSTVPASKKSQARLRLDVFNFKHRKLSKKARQFQPEVRHFTYDIIEINRKIHESASLCKFRIDCFGAQVDKKHLIHPRQSQYFDDLLYHVENLVFRIQAYRDKLCLFINYALSVGFDENESGLFSKLLKNAIIKDDHMDTELKKFTKFPLKDLLERRKLMSHKRYFHTESYNPLFVPEVSPKDVGYKKAARLWTKNIVSEYSRSDLSVKRILEINKKIAEKTLAILNKKA